MKVHFDKDPDKRPSTTRCGVIYYADLRGNGEGDTLTNSRIEFTDEPKRVTCKRCKNGMEADWRLSK